VLYGSESEFDGSSDEEALRPVNKKGSRALEAGKGKGKADADGPRRPLIAEEGSDDEPLDLLDHKMLGRISGMALSLSSCPSSE
jgi:hypothetical protein